MGNGWILQLIDHHNLRTLGNPALQFYSMDSTQQPFYFRLRSSCGNTDDDNGIDLGIPPGNPEYSLFYHLDFTSPWRSGFDSSMLFRWRRWR